MRNHNYVICWKNFDTKENDGKKSFHMFRVPNHRQNGDYYEKPCLSYLTDDFNSKVNGKNKSFL